MISEKAMLEHLNLQWASFYAKHSRVWICRESVRNDQSRGAATNDHVVEGSRSTFLDWESHRNAQMSGVE